MQVISDLMEFYDTDVLRTKACFPYLAFSTPQVSLPQGNVN